VRCRSQPKLIADACRRADARLDAIREKPGGWAMDWSGFRRVVELVANRNGIKPTIIVTRDREVQGRFIEIAEAFERLLPRYMRSNTRDALAKRLRSAKRA
jgi:hypothetical protein